MLVTALSILATVGAFLLLVLIHELGHYLVARWCGMRVDRFSIGFGPVIFARKHGDTEYAVSLLPLGGYVKIAGMSPGDDVDPSDPNIYSNQPAWRRFLVILAGPWMNYVAAVVLTVALLTTLGVPEPDGTASVGHVTAGRRGAAAGMMPGDRVVAIDGQPIGNWRELVTAVEAHAEKDMAVRVERSSKELVELTARPENDGGVGRLMIRPQMRIVKLGLGDAVVRGFTSTNLRIAGVLSGLSDVIRGKQKAEFMGPIGIGNEMMKQAQTGAREFLDAVSFISIMLGLINLFPIPALDGGRLSFLLIEIITRRRVNEKIESYAHLVGAVALFGLIIAVSVFGDLARLFQR